MSESHIVEYHILVNLADFECMDEPDHDVWTSPRVT